MKRNHDIVKLELNFLKNIKSEKILETKEIDQSVENALDLLSQEKNLSREELLQIILVNFKYSVVEALKENNITFDFTLLTTKEICYFYFMNRLKDASKYLK